MSYVVDASVVIKWFHWEPLEDLALALLRAHGGNLEAPDFLLVEVANVSWKRVRLGEMTTEKAITIMTEIHDYIAKFHPSEDMVGHALDISLALDHPVYDCLYLACAEASGRVLITDDTKLAAAVTGTAYESLVQPLAGTSFTDPADGFH